MRHRRHLVEFLIGGLLSTAIPATAQIAVESVISGLDQPVRLVAPPNDDRLFVVEKTGRILVFDQAGALVDTFLNISNRVSIGGERGLLGLAFPSDHAVSGRCYVNYTDLAGDTNVERYQTGADPDRLDPDSAQRVLLVNQPYGNHNGGHLEIGPDGMLYVGLGDGGSAGDPGNRAQNGEVLLGKMLRLDVSGAAGYTIPTDNPFVGPGPRDEIWAIGLRNPWCYAFDRLTGDLYIADVGQNIIEEINVQAATSRGGKNYGWRLMEGSACYEPEEDCREDSLDLPVREYLHGGNPYRCSISGGYVYRGTAIPDLAGQYFYADYCSKQIWSLSWVAGAGATPSREWTNQLTPAGGYGALASFGQDGHGELYILDIIRGRVYRMVPSAADVPAPLRTPYLEQNAPNPFNPLTRIHYAALSDRPLSLRVFGPDGRLVRTLMEGYVGAGPQVAEWDGTDHGGRRVAAGVYLCRLKQGDVHLNRKMVLLE